MRQALINESGIVTNIIVGDGGGVVIPHDSPVTMGWKYINGGFCKPDKTAEQVEEEINSAYHAAINVIAFKYPATERDSWGKQESEARAYISNNSAPTPLLSAIAAARGITVTELASRVIEHADAYTLLAGQLIGRKKARMDAIAAAVAANDHAALDAVEW